MARSSQATTVLYASPKFLRRARWFLLLPSALAAVVVALSFQLATHADRLARPLPAPPPFLPAGTTAGQLLIGMAVVLVPLIAAAFWALRVHERIWRNRPFLTIGPQGLDLMRGGFVPWDEIAAIVATEASFGMPKLVHVVVRPGFAKRRARAAGKTGFAAFWDAFTAPVMTHRGFGAPTLSITTAMVDMKPADLAAILERYRVKAVAASLAAAGEERLVAR